jgi:hypothetical protein
MAEAVVAVYVVTYRRPHLLRRAIESVVNQTFKDWELRVVNDDPADDSVGRVIDTFKDKRISLFHPVMKRGASGSFNEVFKAEQCEFSTLLEDDNWWDSRFLEVMVSGLRAHPTVAVACGNERIWIEHADGSWLDSGKTVWPQGDDELFTTDLLTACGSAKLCNSSMLVRRTSENWTTPDDIPVDVTEHFRERVIPQPMLLINEVMVNYAETLQTNRARGGTLWADYQVLLIGSVFSTLPHSARQALAFGLMKRFEGRVEPRVTSLLMTALSVPKARILFRQASCRQVVKLALTLIRHPSLLGQLLSVTKRHAGHWKWLLAQRFAKSCESASSACPESS